MSNISTRNLAKWIGVGLLLLVALGVLLPAIPPNEISRHEKHICIHCGLGRYQQQVTVAGAPELVLESRENELTTPLSTWYANHFDTPCKHAWRRLHSSGVGYRRIGPWRFKAGAAGAGSSVTPDLIFLEGNNRSELNALFAHDPTVCQQHITELLQGRHSEK